MKLAGLTFLALALCIGVAAAQDTTTTSSPSSPKQDMKAAGHATGTAAKDTGHATKTAGKDVGHATGKAGKATGHATATAGKSVGHATKKVFHDDTSKPEAGSSKGEQKPTPQ